MSFVDQDEIFKATNGGLDVILHYYPSADKCINNNKKFKIRATEKTASCTLKKLPDGNYVVTDFGGDSKPRNAIGVVRLEESCDYKTAIQIIAELFNILPEQKKAEVFAAKVRKSDALPAQLDGDWNFVLGKYTEKDLRMIFSEKTIEYVEGKCEKENATNKNTKNTWVDKLSKLCESYYMYKVDNYTSIKNREATNVASTEHFPIFLFEILVDGKKIRKVYQPLSQDKQWRFFFAGSKKPEGHIFGADNCEKAHYKLNEKVEAEVDEKGNTVQGKQVLLPEIILCSGGSDALNLAALDYQVIWLNSESASFTRAQYNSISKFTNKVCLVPDLDSTGKRTAHELCMKFLDLYTIVLPEELTKHKDWRGNPCKDIRDYLKFNSSKAFEGLLKDAMCYKFWEEIPQFEKGKFIKSNYECDNTHLYWFLQQNGFYRYRNKNNQKIFNLS